MATGFPLESFGRAPTRAGLFLDYDGVLADIVDAPDGARPRTAVPRLLAALDQRLGRVAILSGRPVAYLAEHLPSAVDLVGLYGLETRTDGRFSTWDEAEQWRGIVSTVAAAAVGRFGAAAVEAKGLSLTLHYRNGDSTESEVTHWADQQAESTGLERRAARMSVEMHPPVERDKGMALTELASGLGAVAFMGDDVGDLPAFDALDQLARNGVEVLRIAVDSPEAPTPLIERADLVVAGPEGAERLLESLLEMVESASG